ncbi:MAG: hypothetical protein CVU56_24995 [Deltaproteobacteria bacterium HGW-Deltaproteobacteria-14]|nr:MAG: hypothetical protein CVU56_24995 [Deltaproteobacteria bacterium HGW-Deltaproteobacteria-14]
MVLAATPTTLPAPLDAADSGSVEADGVALGDPHGRYGTWDAPRPAVQADQDPRIGPAATGAVFVPAMTDSVLEPLYLVRDAAGDEVAATPMGRKTFLVPGRYTVVVGSGPEEGRLSFDTVVVEGRVTWVPAEWTGLVVNVVDARGNPFRGSYELVRMPARDYVGLGLGAAIAQGERLSTWVLYPGRYMILLAGESYQARRNFVTLRLPPGELVQYTLVLDSDTGELLGAGEIASFRPQQWSSGWNGSLVLGGTFELNQSDKVVGRTDGTLLGISGFVESLFGYRDEPHRFYGRLNLEAGGDLRLPDRPFVSNVDELTLDLLYVYRVAPWFGPYARASIETQVLPGIQPFDQPTDVRKLDHDGAELGVERQQQSFTLADAFAPIEPRYGTGLRFDANFGGHLSLATRVGVGGRHVFTRGLFILNDDPSTAELEVRRIRDVTQFGAEAALVAELTLGRWVVLKLDTNVLFPFDDYAQTFVDFRGVITLRLTSFASLNYTVRIKDDPALSADTQFDHAVLLRLAYKLF